MFSCFFFYKYFMFRTFELKFQSSEYKFKRTELKFKTIEYNFFLDKDTTLSY